MYYQLTKSSYQDSLKVLEVDIRHPNALGKDGVCLHMKLVYNDWAPVVLFLLQRIDCSCICLLPLGVILPSLTRLYRNLEDLEKFGKRGLEGDNRFSNVDIERESECGICLEPCTKIVLPTCCHAVYKMLPKLNMKSESCPFCRGSLKRVNSQDLWVLTYLLSFYLYINSLPKDYPDTLFLVHYEYLF
ncbi:hypothetical protein K2173_005789 [Erythroxylum novogranatense]|uniref:RING-type domain-containing protein n=1 Tax=Erythroxylum novogranatense TaxID=1862640 RepID=A0AAV8U5G5_9ROSI|nr:hypothetical protein K2173_005789 [Erythroxylum novogranatense]